MPMPTTRDALTSEIRSSNEKLRDELDAAGPCASSFTTSRLLPGARLVSHWLWRYTLAWDRPRRDV